MAQIKKTRQERLEELRQSLVVIRHGFEMVMKAEEFAHFLPVAGQLRALLVRSRTNHPLLLELADEVGFPLELYSIPLDFLEQREAILVPQSIQWTGDSVRATDEGPPFVQKVTMDEWLDSTQVIVYGKRITGKQLIQMIANKLGGSHFDRTMPNELREMTLFEIGGLPSQYMTLVRVADVVARLGEDLLDHVERY